MSPNPIRIAQISDLHIKPPGALAYGRVDTAKALQRCVAALNEFTPTPDFVVISGDLADTPTAEEYEHLKRLLVPASNDLLVVRPASPLVNSVKNEGPELLEDLSLFGQ